MWIHRKKSEIEKERKRKYLSIKDPLFIATVIFLSTTLIIKTGYNKWAGPSIDPISWSVFFDTGLIKALKYSFIFFIISYFWQLYIKRPLFGRAPTLICSKCYKVKAIDKNFSCECGGQFIKIDEMEWVSN